MTPRIVTFDCAQTLVEVPEGWSLGKFAVDCARSVGLTPSERDGDLYLTMYYARIREFLEINRARDLERAEAFWRTLAQEWLAATGQPVQKLDAVQAAAEELGFGPNSILFKLYDDVIPCLNQLDAMGIKAAIVSNWDYSLHRVVRMFNLYDRFVTVKASLEEGVEKPDPRLFEIALKDAGFSASEAFHVGDSFEDDYVGAQAAGMRVVLIDRALADAKPGYIRTLAELPEAFGWTA